MESIPGHVARFDYNARGQVKQADYANGVVTTNTYDEGRAWLDRVVTRKGTATHQDVTFTRNSHGLIESVTSAAGLPNNGDLKDSWTYIYDPLDRLKRATNAWQLTFGANSLSQFFEYDDAHNMTRNTQVGGATAGYYTYAAVTPGPNPRPIPHAVSAAGDYVLAYDKAGNQISKTSTLSSHVLAWDAENKLAQVTIGAAVYKYLYGADHARVLKVVPHSSGPDKVTVYLGPDAEINDTGIWTKYLHDQDKSDPNGHAAGDLLLRQAVNGWVLRKDFPHDNRGKDPGCGKCRKTHR